MIRRPPRSTQSRSSAASDVYKRQAGARPRGRPRGAQAPVAEGGPGLRGLRGLSATDRPGDPARDPRAALGAERPGDHHLLDLVGALADREDLRVAIEAAHRVLLDEAVAAVYLHGLLGAAHGQAAGLQ